MLTDVETPLHDAPLPDGYWWFCMEPERLPDVNCATDWCCPKCILKTRVHLAAVGDECHTDPSGEYMSHMASEILRRLDAGEKPTRNYD